MQGSRLTLSPTGESLNSRPDQPEADSIVRNAVTQAIRSVLRRPELWLGFGVRFRLHLRLVLRFTGQ